MGRRAMRPHTGGHVYFNTLSKSKSLSVQDYPPIYAVADGVITRIDYSYELRSMFEPTLGKAVANRRYGIGLTFAKDGLRLLHSTIVLNLLYDPITITFTTNSFS